MKWVAVGWLILLAAVHFCRDWFFMAHLYAEAKWFLLPWGMSSYLLPAAFTFIKKPQPLLAGNIPLTIYELWFTYQFVFATHPSGGAWWIIEPIFLSVIFAIPATVVWAFQKLGSSRTKTIEDKAA